MNVEFATRSAPVEEDICYSFFLSLARSDCDRQNETSNGGIVTERDRRIKDALLVLN